MRKTKSIERVVATLNQNNFMLQSPDLMTSALADVDQMIADMSFGQKHTIDSFIDGIVSAVGSAAHAVGTFVTAHKTVAEVATDVAEDAAEVAAVAIAPKTIKRRKDIALKLENNGMSDALTIENLIRIRREALN